MKKGTTTAAQREAIKRYDQKFERIYTRLPIGTRDRIEATGAKSVNTFIVQAVQEKLNREETGK